MPEQSKYEDYIGDGVYTEYDGYGIWLKANHHLRPTDKVYLEPDVLHKLIKYAKRIGVIQCCQDQSPQTP